MFCSLDPRNILISYTYAGDEGEVGEKDHGSLANLGVVGVRPEVVGGGGSTTEPRWRRSSSKSGELRRARAGAAVPSSFTGGRGRRVGARPGQCRGRGGSSA